MSYNWERIFKNKTDKELYYIYFGEILLNTEARNEAKKELISRKFDFDNIVRHKKKWELEELIKEEQGKKSFFSIGSSNSKDFKAMLIFGFIFILVGIFYFLYCLGSKPCFSSTFVDKTGPLLMGLIAVLVGTIGFRRTRRKEQKRKNRIAELIKEL